MRGDVALDVANLDPRVNPAVHGLAASREPSWKREMTLRGKALLDPGESDLLDRQKSHGAITSALQGQIWLRKVVELATRYDVSLADVVIDVGASDPGA